MKLKELFGRGFVEAAKRDWNDFVEENKLKSWFNNLPFKYKIEVFNMYHTMRVYDMPQDKITSKQTKLEQTKVEVYQE